MDCLVIEGRNVVWWMKLIKIDGKETLGRLVGLRREGAVD